MERIFPIASKAPRELAKILRAVANWLAACEDVFAKLPTTKAGLLEVLVADDPDGPGRHVLRKMNSKDDLMLMALQRGVDKALQDILTPPRVYK